MTRKTTSKEEQISFREHKAPVEDWTVKLSLRGDWEEQKGPLCDILTSFGHQEKYRIATALLRDLRENEPYFVDYTICYDVGLDPSTDYYDPDFRKWEQQA